MDKLTFDYSKATGFVTEAEIKKMAKAAEKAKETLLARSGAGNDFLGWIDLPEEYDKDEVQKLLQSYETVENNFILI